MFVSIKSSKVTFVTALSGILFSASVFANTDCTIDADLHPESNIGYEVGDLCPMIELQALNGTELKLIDGNQGQCERVLSTSKGNTMQLKFDVTKGSQELGAACKVLTVFANGSSRIIGIQQFAD